MGILKSSISDFIIDPFQLMDKNWYSWTKPVLRRQDALTQGICSFMPWTTSSTVQFQLRYLKLSVSQWIIWINTHPILCCLIGSSHNLIYIQWFKTTRLQQQKQQHNHNRGKRGGRKRKRAGREAGKRKRRRWGGLLTKGEHIKTFSPVPPHG